MDEESNPDMASLNEYRVLLEDGRGGWDVQTFPGLDPSAAVRYAIRSTHWAQLASLMPHDFDWSTPGRRFSPIRKES